MAARHPTWLLARRDDITDTLSAQIESYGYHVRRLDMAAGVPVPTSPPFPETVIIDAPPQEPSAIACIQAAAGLGGFPGVLVIDRGLEPVDRILAFEAGADDCVVWPCGPRELVARIRAIERRRRGAGTIVCEPGAEEKGEVLAFGPWTIDRAQRRLSRPGKPHETLSVAEFAVLDELLRRPRKVIAREALLQATAAADGPEARGLRAIDIQISRLRKRLEIDDDEIIRTVRGRGYMLLPPVVPA